MTSFSDRRRTCDAIAWFNQRCTQVSLLMLAAVGAMLAVVYMS
jgi:hypothetical protein